MTQPGLILFNAQNKTITDIVVPPPTSQGKFGIYGMGPLTDASFNNMRTYIQGWFFRMDWSEVQPTRGAIAWAPLETGFQRFFNDNKYICFQVNLASKNAVGVTPPWIYNAPDSVPKVFAQGSTTRYMPYYLEQSFVDRVEDLYELLMTGFATRPLYSQINNGITNLSRVLFIMSAEGTTGDEGTGEIDGPYGFTIAEPQLYRIPLNIWIQHRRTQWTMIKTKMGANTPNIQLMMNPGNQGTEHPWIMANIAGACIKSGFPAHEYNFPGTLEYVGRFNSLRTMGPIVYGSEYTVRGEHENEQQQGWWGQQARANEFSQGCQCIHLNNSYYSFTSQNALGEHYAYDFYNKYAGSRVATDTNKGFCQLRDLIDLADTVRFPEGTYGNVTTLTDAQYAQQVQAINNSNDSPSLKANRITKLKLNNINNVRVTDIVNDFPLANYAGVIDTCETCTNGLMQDFSVDSIPDNYFRYVTQWSPNTTSNGRWRESIANSFHGRHAREFRIVSGIGEMFFTIDPGLDVGNNTFKITVVYLDRGTGVWAINMFRSGIKSEIKRTTNVNSDTWKTVTVDPVTNVELGGNLLHGSDLTLQYISGANTMFSVIEVENLSVDGGGGGFEPKFGADFLGLTAIQEATACELSGFVYVRDSITVQGFSGVDLQLKARYDAGLKIVCNLTYQPQNSLRMFPTSPAQLAEYRLLIRDIMDLHGNMFELVVIENEPTNGSYYNIRGGPNSVGPPYAEMEDYLKMLAIAIEECHAAGVKVTDGGTHLEYYNAVMSGNFQADSGPYHVNELLGGVGSTPGYDGLNLDFVNFHFHTPGVLDNGSLMIPNKIKTIADYMHLRTGHPVMSNEWHQENSTDDPTPVEPNNFPLCESIVDEMRKANVQYAINFGGDGVRPSLQLHEIVGGVVQLTLFGETYRDAIAGV